MSYEDLEQATFAIGRQKSEKFALEPGFKGSLGTVAKSWPAMVAYRRQQGTLADDERRTTDRVIETLQKNIELLEQQIASMSEEHHAVYNTTIYALGHSKYELAMPLQVVVEEDETETVARVPELNIYASADTDSEAIYDLKQELVNLFEHLLTSKNKLGPLPKSQLETLKRLIVEKHG